MVDMLEQGEGFPGVLRWLERLKSEGVVSDYAITGAVAASIWGEATATQDLDVAVLVGPGSHSPLDPLRPILDWLRENGYELDGEHVIVNGVPVQLLPSWHPVVDEAIKSAVELPYDEASEDSPKMRLITATHLVATWRTPGAQTARRAERAAMLKEAGAVDDTLLGELVKRYGL